MLEPLHIGLEPIKQFRADLFCYANALLIKVHCGDQAGQKACVGIALHARCRQAFGLEVQFKSWADFNATTFVRQISKDYALTNHNLDNLKWIFERKGSIHLKRDLMRQMNAAMNDAVSKGNLDAKIRDAVQEKLASIVKLSRRARR